MTLVRTELGEQADALVPLKNGGVVLAKLQGVMHDTCNTANAIARRVKAIRDDSGKDLSGKTFSAVITRVTYILTRSIDSLRRI